MHTTSGPIGLILGRLDRDRDSALARRVLAIIRSPSWHRALYRMLPRAEMRERGPTSAAMGWTCIVAFSAFALLLAVTL